MLTELRREEIVKIVNERKSVTVQELKDIYDASESTIRRDITTLSKEGKLIKVFGGAVCNDSTIISYEPTVAQKVSMNVDEKKKIAQYAARLIEWGDCVFIDAGTTTELMVDYITEMEAIYVTNAVSHARKLAENGFKVILIGGELKGNTEAAVGADTVVGLQRYHFSKGFFGTNGVSIKEGFTTPDINEALVKETAINSTMRNHRYILCDHEKIGKISSVTFSKIDNATIITDSINDEKLINATRIIVPD